MPRGSYLSEVEKGKILAFLEENVSFREIGRRINRSEKVIRNFVKNKENYGQNKSGGPKNKLSARTKRRIINMASNSTKSTNTIVKELQLNVHRSTVSRVLKQSPHIEHQKLQKMPRLLSGHKASRLEFARNNMNTDWKKVFSTSSCAHSLSNTIFIEYSDRRLFSPMRKSLI